MTDEHDESAYTYLRSSASNEQITVQLVDDGDHNVSDGFKSVGRWFDMSGPILPTELDSDLDTRKIDCLLYVVHNTELKAEMRIRNTDLPVFLLVTNRELIDMLASLATDVTDIFKIPDTQTGWELLARRIRNHTLVAQIADSAPETVENHSTRWYRSTFEHSPDMVIVHDETGTILDANRQACTHLGYEYEELIELSVPQIEVGIDRGELEELWSEYEYGEPIQVEGQHRRKDGSVFPVEVNLGKVPIDGTEQFIAIARDLTARVERERELRTYQEAVDFAGHAVMITDIDGTIEYVNQAFEEISGFDQEEAIGRTPRILNSGKHDEVFYADLWETILAGERWHGEIINSRKDGSLYVVDKTISPIVDEGGTPKKFVATNREITQRKEFEEQLTALHASTRNLLEVNSKEEVADIAVQAAEQLLGFSLPSVWYPRNGGDDLVLIANSAEHQRLLEDADQTSPHHPQDSWLWEVFEAGETKVLDSISQSELAADVPLQSGVVFPLSDHGVLACASRREDDFDKKDRRLIEILGRNVVAILDHLEHREQLQRYQRYSADLLDALEDVIYVLRDDGTFEGWNESLCRVTGYGDEEITSMTAAELIAEEQRTDFQDAIEAAFNSGRVQLEADLRSKDGETTPYEFVANTFENPNKTQVLGGIGRDITERKAHEQTLREQNQELERRQEQIQFFNSLLRHDVLNGMTVIRGYAEILLEEFDDEDDLYTIIDSIHTRSTDIVELIQEVRSVLQRFVEDGDTGLTEKPLVPIVTERVERTQRAYPKAEIELHVQDAPKVIADELLADILNNLLINAIQHTDRETPQIEIEIETKSNTASVRIADNGPGIPDHKKEHIFKQGKGDPDTATGGFGLYFVKTMVERYGGTVWVEDNEPRGAVFSIELPRA